MAPLPESFHPDNPANALIYVWPGVPIVAFALGFAFSTYRLVQGVTLAFALLAVLMATGLLIVLGLLIHALCFRWYVVTVDGHGVRLHAVGRARIGVGDSVAMPWSAVQAAGAVTAPDGTSVLSISAGWRTYQIPPLAYRAETYEAMARALRSHFGAAGRAPLSDAPRAA